MTRRRRISTRERLAIFEREKATCHLCDGKIDGTLEAWDVSHEIPLELGGDDEGDNLRVAHRKCHRLHTAERDIPQIAKAKRVQRKHIGAHRPRATLPGSKGTRWKRKIDGTVVPRQ